MLSVEKTLKQEIEQWKHEYEVLDACCELAQGKIAELKAENEQLKKYIERMKEPELKVIDANIALENAELKDENERLKSEIKNNKSAYEVELGTYNMECGNLLEENKELAHYLACMTEQRNKANTILQEIKAIAKAPSPYIDNFEIKTATEVGYDYAAICNELELRLHKVLELITKAGEE